MYLYIVGPALPTDTYTYIYKDICEAEEREKERE